VLGSPGPCSLCVNTRFAFVYSFVWVQAAPRSCARFFGWCLALCEHPSTCMCLRTEQSSQPTAFVAESPCHPCTAMRPRAWLPWHTLPCVRLLVANNTALMGIHLIVRRLISCPCLVTKSGRGMYMTKVQRTSVDHNAPQQLTNFGLASYADDACPQPAVVVIISISLVCAMN
jgi:hypothetical protein